MTETQTAVWKPVPGFSRYEASAGQAGVATTAALSPVRRTAGGAAMTARRQNRGYWVVDLTGDDGVRRTITVHRVVLLAHRGRPGAGEKTRHLDDDPSHNWVGNLVWGTQPENERDKFANGRPKPVPPRRPPAACILCGRPAARGKRCHACVVDLGRRGARLLRAGVPLEVAALRLDYQPAHLHTLAVRYGGYGVPWPRRARARLVTLRARIGAAATAVTHRDRS